MLDMGLVRPGATLRIPFSTFDKDDGSSITMTNFAVADILIYKDGSTTERASTSGFTATTDFDAKTGKHLLVIDLADNTTADFFAAGSEYLVAIDAVTVDAVTTGGWVARFCIGYQGATLNTTIATLASQTSFTLTNGPAEDDALNGLWCIIHDAASAVQWAWGIVSDYTGSTKTVTLAAGATFTVAAKDNISIMGPAPLQPTVAGAKEVVQTGDSYAIVNSGTHGNAALKTLIDTVDNFVDTEIADIQARLPAALVGGRIDANVGAISSDATAADNAEAFFDGTGYAGTGNVIPTVTTLTNLPAITANWLTATGIADGAITAAKIADNAIDRATFAVDTGLRSIHSGTLAVGGTSSVILDSGASSANDFYTWYVFKTESGAGADQARLIKAYNGISKVAQLDPPLVTAVDGTTVFTILPWASVNVHSIGEVEPNNLISGRLDVSVGECQANTLTAAALASDAVSEIQSGLATQASVNTIDDFLDTEIAAILAAVDTEVAAIQTAVVTTIPATLAALFTTALTESYRADGATGSVAQLLYELLAHHAEKSISGTTLTTKKLDGSTTAATHTLNSSTTPTSVTRAS